MSLWGRVFAFGYDTMMRESEAAGLRDRRQALLSRACGRVLEIGAGTGANLPFYGAAVDELVLTEPEQPMFRRLRQKVASARPGSLPILAPAERLPVDDASFNFVVSTLVLCTVADPTAALAEIHRALRRNGQLLFLEHVRSEDPGLAAWQDRLRAPWSWFGHGCQCNRRTLDAINAAGFDVAEVEHGELPKALPLVRPLIAGAAIRR